MASCSGSSSVWGRWRRWERLTSWLAHVSGELVRAAEEHGRFRVTGVLVVRMLTRRKSSAVRQRAVGAVGDAMVETTPDERYVARG